jgi:hypothetical protein
VASNRVQLVAGLHTCSLGWRVCRHCPPGVCRHGLSLVGMLPQVVGLAMNTNAEDKSNFMRLIYSECLCTALFPDPHDRLMLHIRSGHPTTIHPLTHSHPL